MAHTRIKICGITRPEDARAAADCGADAIGLVFYGKSSRAIDVRKAAGIVAALPPFVTVVALFVDETVAGIERVLAEVPIDVLQFHGDETRGFCEQFQRPYVKALRVRPGLDLRAASGEHAAARGVLLDSWQEGMPGGTGKTFDWKLADQSLSLPVILAGGLNPGNVGAAIHALRPQGVDVSGGVERGPGIKDAATIAHFVAAVREADRS